MTILRASSSKSSNSKRWKWSEEPARCSPPPQPGWLSGVPLHPIPQQGSELPRPTTPLLQSCSTTTSSCRGPNTSSHKALGLAALQQTLRAHSIYLGSSSSCCIGVSCLIRREMLGTRAEWLQKKGKWESKKLYIKHMIRQAPGTDSCFATCLFSRSLHHFFAEEFKGSLNRGGSQYLLRSFPLPLRQSLLARTPSHLVCQIQLCMFSLVPSF